MRRNYLLLSLLGFFVVSYAAPDERRKFVRVITEPKPGEEYVSIHTGKPSSPGGHRRTPLADDDMTVAINDEGQTGIKEVTGPVPTEEKIYAHKKIYPIVEDEPMKRTKQEKKYTEEVTPEIFVSKSINNKLNKNRRDGDITTHSPSKVHKNLNSNSEDDGLYDFVDSPYGGQLVGSASSQASRVNIKKAPNGQEYEYEYVYYYYDEDEEHPKSGSKTGQSASNSTPQQQSNTKPNKETNSKPKKPAVVQDENQFVQNTNKGRFSAIEHTISSEEPEGHGNFAVNDIAEHNSKTKESARNLEEALSVPSSSLAVSEERLPHNPRFPARSRGNTRPPPEIETTLPLTDTPITRIRGGNTGTHQPGLDLVDSNAFRTHSSSGQHMSTSPRHESVRDAVVQTTPMDQVATINNAYNTQPTEAVASVTETVSLDRNQDNTDVDTKVLTTTLTPDEVVTVTQRYTAGSTDKGAVDLYAILQQARSEETANTIASSEHSTRYEDNETQYPTTLRLAPTTTTTTTTTTPAPTTTTTTTTAPLPTRQSSGTGPVRNRYRGSVGSRVGLTPTVSTTTTEVPQPSEEVTEKRRFKPSRERTSQGSVYSKRYQSSTAALDKESSTTESEVVTRAQKPSFGRQRTRTSKPVSSTLASVPIEENVEVSSAAPRPNFAERSNLRRQNSRNKFTTTASTTTTTAVPQVAEEEEENNAAEHEVSEPTTTTAKAVGGRLRPNIRPLRPGLRLNFGGKGSSTTAAPTPSTTQAPMVESSPDEVEEKESVPETSPTPTPDSLSRLKNRSRFRVPEKQSSLAPKQQTLTPPATGQNRKHLLSNLLPKKKSIQTEEPPVSVEPAVLENEQEFDQTQEFQNKEEPSTTTSTTEAPTSSTNRLSSLLAKRRPLQRRPADLSKQSNPEE